MFADARRHDPAKRPPKAPSRPGAFSLVELIVVMVILGMLSGLVAVQTRGYLVSSKQNAAKAEIATIVSAIDTFYADRARYPSVEEGLEVLAEPTPNFPDGFLKRVPRDPWGNRYELYVPGNETAFEVVCFGGDGREGGRDGDRDITSETLREG